MLNIRLSREILMLLPILIISFVIRLWGINFGLPFFLHPDETKLIEPAISMAFGIKEALLAGDIQHFDPNFFFYPSFLMYLLMWAILGLKLVYIPLGMISLGKLSFAFLTKPAFYLLARFISVLFGLATVYLVYRLGLKLRDQKVGLLAASLLGFSFFHSLNSHYYTGDVGATFFTILSIYFLFNYWSTSPWPAKLSVRLKPNHWLYTASISIGFGIATKYYPVLMLVPLVIVVYLKEKKWIDRWTQWLLSGLISFITFLILVPFSLINFSLFFKEFLISSKRSETGVFGFTSDNFWYYLTSTESSFIEPFTQNSLWQGLGTVFLALFLISLVYFCFKKDRKIWLLVFYCVIHYLFFALHQAKIIRWLLPLAPLSAILVALFLSELNQKLKSGFRFVVPLLFLLIIIPNLWRTLVVDLALSREDTRAQAYQWTEDNIPEKSRVAYEYFSIAQFTRRDLYYLEFDHPRYNILGEIKWSRPPDYYWFKNLYQPQFIVINGDLRDRFKTPSMKKLFPDTSKAWLEMYDNIERDYKVAARFKPSFPDNIRAGPEMVIFVPK